MSGFKFTNNLRFWSVMGQPLRPNQDVVAAIQREIGDCRGPALLLGVTAEFASLAEDVVAMDINPAMVEALWLGDTASRRVMVGDWRRMACAPQSFSICLGDGSFTLLRFPDEVALVLDELARVLRGGAKVVCRVFASPEISETTDAIKAAALTRGIESFYTYKWRMGMALAARYRGFNVPVRAILDAFNEMFPDREELARITGWNRVLIDAIDEYLVSSSTFSFPPRSALVAEIASKAFSSVRFVSAGTYELAEHCPLLVMERR